ncbi:MAG: uracil-DNA glycosylase, partial [Planctomycetota bacterium]|nr:uracil-DNA glycosylase [Planctomycetota bacterium]
MPDPTNRRVLRQHLQTERLLGQEAVPVRKSAKRAASTQPPATAQPIAPDAPPPAAMEASRRTTRPAAASPPVPAPALDPLPAPGPALSGAALFAANAPASGPPPLPREKKVELLLAMDEGEVRGCTKCGLCKGRTQTVFGEGDPDAKIMFVGEVPGQTEDETGRPFVGRAGELLDKMIVAMGLRREDVYIANIVKCRPPENRPPTPAESETCWGYLRRQIETVQPRVLVTLGS